MNKRKNLNERQYKIERLYKTFHPRLIRFILPKVGCLHTAEELTQDVFTKICGHANIPETSSPTTKAYMYRAANNIVIDHYRKNSRNIKTLPFVEIEEISSFDIRKMGIEETVIENEILSTLHRKIEELNLAERNMYLSKVLKVRGKRKEFTSFYRKRNKIVKKINMEIKEELKKFYEKEE